MPFKIRSAYVSHFGMPSGLDNTAELTAYIEDVDQEIAALKDDWAKYNENDSADAVDLKVFENALERLRSLRDEAQQRLKDLQ